jgi:hypothetical protein
MQVGDIQNYKASHSIISSKKRYLTRRGLRMGVHDGKRISCRKVQISLNHKEATYLAKTSLK